MKNVSPPATFATTFLLRTGQSVLILERHHNHFQLPKLGYVESRCLGNTLYLQDEDFSCSKTQALCSKTNSHSSATSPNQSPFVIITRYDWCNPYKYDLTRFQSTNPTSYAHPDSVIFTLSHPTSLITQVP